MYKKTVLARRGPVLAAALIVALHAPLALAWSSGAPYGGQPCDTELNTVGYAVDGATYTGQKPAADRANLLAKLDSARAKVGLAKFADALAKLDDLHATVEAMAGAAKPKLAESSTAAIYTALGGAALCIGRL